ncbi:methyltransferase [Reyranella sp.]|uniref:methyltransferase n=1 Tax=Reyranella sp. TaxID=1929291 RepID=UPI00272EEB7A|nr:methyltransferase [Reyranella sp.]MDP2375157.1 methyltransferase [Reyranella sp.]
MAFLSARSRSFCAVVGRNGSTFACALLVLVVLLGAALERSLPLVVWLLSFWHYYLFWLAFAFGTAPFDIFMRDAAVMKTVSVAALAAVYLAAPLDFVSLAVIAGGILLNVRAAAVLGIDRTYYGHEVAGLPRTRVTAFPYSLMAHPMIVGNVAAFGGTLINPAFAEQWWPLVCLHVALNIGLLVMELAGRGRAVRIGGGLVFTGVLVAAILATLPGALLGAATVACAWALYRCYAQTVRRAS